MEEIVKFFESNSVLQKRIYGRDSEVYRVYQSSFNLKPDWVRFVDSTHIFWANPIGYNERIAPVFDNYKVKGFDNYLIDKTAHIIFYLSTVLAVLSIFLLLYYFLQIKNISEDQNEIKHNNTCL